jgi:excinuclease ABC subunit C
MPIRDLKDQIARLPEQPGVYLYANRSGDTIYVGKARSLRDRVRSYLRAYGSDPKTDALLGEAERLEVIVTDSVVEALALENHLIKQRAPKYNILLRDDKNYPYLRLTTSEASPRILVARRVERDGDFYAGPLIPAWFARRTMSLTHRLFGIRSCNEIITGQRGRPCLEYDIKRCLAPCVASICSPEEYGRAVEDTKLFLEGRNDELLKALRGRMLAASEAERFEQAAQVRDAIRTIETLRDRQQKIATVRLGDRDAFGVRIGAEGAVVLVFQMRSGRVIDRVELATDPTPGGASESEVLQAAIQQFYQDQVPPPEVHVPAAPEDAEWLEAWLTERAGRRVHLVVPRRGEKRSLLQLATRNAALAFDHRFNEQGAANYAALDELRQALSLPAWPRRIECFDVSTIQGSETVASMVVCEQGRMRRSDYRKFRIKGDGGAGLAARELGRHVGRSRFGAAPALATSAAFKSKTAPSSGQIAPTDRPAPDDFAAMCEVVVRRYRRVLEEGGPFPDLILIDGGKGQLSAAYEGLRAVGLENLVAVGLAKREELLFTRDRSEPIELPATSAALHLVQRIRDEAHRFAVTFHRRARAMRDLRSELDEVPGIGVRRRKTLLARFGSVAGVRRASREELAAAVGTRGADAILTHFAEEGSK